MPINVFGITSGNNEKKINTSLLVQKPYLRTNYIESNVEEDIDMKSQNRSKKLFNPLSITEAASNIYVDYIFNNPGIIKNIAHVDFNDKNLKNVLFVNVESLLSIIQHLTLKENVDDPIDEISLDRKNQNNDFNNFNLTNIIRIILNTKAVNDNHDITKAYVD